MNAADKFCNKFDGGRYSIEFKLIHLKALEASLNCTATKQTGLIIEKNIPKTEWEGIENKSHWISSVKSDRSWMQFLQSSSPPS